MAAALGFSGVGVANIWAVPVPEPQGKTCKAFTTATHAPINAGFFANIVQRRPVTLIGDGDHRNSNMYAVLGDEAVMRGWAANGVSDIYLEIRPDVHQRIASYLQPFDHDGVKGAFKKYFEEHGLYTAPGWADLRASYLADMVGNALKYNVDFHFISEDPPILAGHPALEDFYKTRSRFDAAYCDNERDARAQAFLKYALSLPAGVLHEATEFDKTLFRERLESDRHRADTIRSNLGRGRAVVLFGDGHFYSRAQAGMDNMRSDLGADQTTFVIESAEYPGWIDFSHNKIGADYGYILNDGSIVQYAPN